MSAAKESQLPSDIGINEVQWKIDRVPGTYYYKFVSEGVYKYADNANAEPEQWQSMDARREAAKDLGKVVLMADIEKFKPDARGYYYSGATRGLKSQMQTIGVKPPTGWIWMGSVLLTKILEAPHGSPWINWIRRNFMADPRRSPKVSFGDWNRAQCGSTLIPQAPMTRSGVRRRQHLKSLPPPRAATAETSDAWPLDDSPGWYYRTVTTNGTTIYEYRDGQDGAWSPQHPSERRKETIAKLQDVMAQYGFPETLLSPEELKDFDPDRIFAHLVDLGS